MLSAAINLTMNVTDDVQPVNMLQNSLQKKPY